MPQQAKHDRLTLVYGWIAAQFNGKLGIELPDYFERHFGGRVSVDTIGRAVAHWQGGHAEEPTSDLLPRGAQPRADAKQGSGGAAISLDSVWVDERALGLRTFLVRFPNQGLDLGELFAALEKMVGFRQVIETQEDLEILAIAVLEPSENKQDLRARVLEHAPGREVRIHEIGRESQAGAAGTWFELARRRAMRTEM